MCKLTCQLWKRVDQLRTVLCRCPLRVRIDIGFDVLQEPDEKIARALNSSRFVDQLSQCGVDNDRIFGESVQGFAQIPAGLRELSCVSLLVATKINLPAYVKVWARILHWVAFASCNSFPCGVGYRADTSLHAETRMARLALGLIQTLFRKAVSPYDCVYTALQAFSWLYWNKTSWLSARLAGLRGVFILRRWRNENRNSLR